MKEQRRTAAAEMMSCNNIAASTTCIDNGGTYQKDIKWMALDYREPPACTLLLGYPDSDLWLNALSITSASISCWHFFSIQFPVYGIIVSRCNHDLTQTQHNGFRAVLVEGSWVGVHHTLEWTCIPHLSLYTASIICTCHHSAQCWPAPLILLSSTY